MHELSITQGIVDICLRHAEDRPVTSVTVEIGALSGVVPEALEFCFLACTAGTVAEHACLVIKRIDGRARCLDCAFEQPLLRYYDPCSQCGNYALEIIDGEQMRVTELDVAD